MFRKGITLQILNQLVCAGDFSMPSTCIISLNPPSSSGGGASLILEMTEAQREGESAPHIADRWQNWSQISGLVLSS